MKIGKPLVYSRPEQRAIIVEALSIFPNVWVVYNYVGKRLSVSYGSIWNIAKAKGIKLIPFYPLYLPKRETAKHKRKLKSPPMNRKSATGEEAPSVRQHAPATRPQRG
jgi:hypothetical protein